MIATVATGSLGKTIGILKGITSGQGGSEERPHPKEHEVIKMALDSYKNIKKLTSTVLGKAGIQISASALLKQSQVFTTLLGSFFQMGGYAVDIILAPFIPTIAGYLSYISTDFIPWLKLFVNDPTGTLFKALLGIDTSRKGEPGYQGEKETWDKISDTLSNGLPAPQNLGAGPPSENMPISYYKGTSINPEDLWAPAVAAGEYADRQAHIIATATDLWAQPLIRASEEAAAAAQQATVYSDSSLIAKAAQRKQREQREHMAGISGDDSMMVDFELQRQYEMNLAMADFIEKRKESKDGQYVIDDMAGFF